MDFRKCSVWSAVLAVTSCSSSGDLVKEAKQPKSPLSALLRNAIGCQYSARPPDLLQCTREIINGPRQIYTDENLTLYRLLASSTDVDERRAILRLLAGETAKLKCDLRKIGSEGTGRVFKTRH